MKKKSRSRQILFGLLTYTVTKAIQRTDRVFQQIIQKQLDIHIGGAQISTPSHIADKIFI